MMEGDDNNDPLFQDDGDDLFGAMNAADDGDANTNNNNNSVNHTDNDPLSQQLESMGLSHSHSGGGGAGDALAPPPASAPPPAPPANNTKNESDALMQSLMGDLNDDGYGDLGEGEEDLFGGIGGSGSGGDDGDGDLFGIGDDDDDDDLFQTTVIDQSGTAANSNNNNQNNRHTSSSDEHGGIVIATAPTNINHDPLSPNANSNDHQHNSNNSAMMMSYAPTGEESFYRSHNNNTNTNINMNESNAHAMAQPNTNYRNQQQQQVQSPQPNHGHRQAPAPMASSPSATTSPSFQFHDPAANFMPHFSSVAVNDPKFVAESGGGGLLSSLTGSSTKYWMYTVTSTQTNLPNYKTTQVQRRFRHFDALQDRLRQACPGAILPSRPPKHEAMDVAVGPGGAKQNATFAAQRAAELHAYLGALVHHPIAGNAEPLGFFLTFTDRDLGAAWPEVSTSALTRLTAGMTKTAGEASAAAAAGMSNLGNGSGMNLNGNPSMSHNGMSTMSPNHHNPNNGGNNNTPHAQMTQSEQLAHLLTEETHRMNLVLASIPKLEGFLILLKDVQQSQGLLAMEWSKLNKDLKVDDRAIARLAEIVGLASLKSARRNRTRVTDSIKVLQQPLLQQTKIVHMEKAAFHDRQIALEKVWKLRQMSFQQQQQQQGSQHPQIYHTHPMAQQFQAQTAHSNYQLEDASKRADAISNVLHSEILRLQSIRRREVLHGLKSFALLMKNAQSDVTQIWRDAQANFQKSFPATPFSSSTP